MSLKAPSLAILAAAIALAILGSGNAQTPAAPATPPTYRPGLCKVNIAELLPATTKEPMEAVAAAIKAADAAKFAEAYGQLTATCNACHQATERSFVIIQAPKISSFPDQDFRPLKP